VAIGGDAASALDCATGRPTPGWPWYPEPSDDSKLAAATGDDATLALTDAIALPDNRLLVAGVFSSTAGGETKGVWLAALDPFGGGGGEQEDGVAVESSSSPAVTLAAAGLKGPYETAKLLARSGRALPLVVALRGGTVDAWDAASAIESFSSQQNPLTSLDLADVLPADVKYALKIEPNSAGVVARVSTPTSSRFLAAVDDETRAAATTTTTTTLVLPLGSGPCAASACVLGAFATPASAASGSGEAGARVFFAELRAADCSSASISLKEIGDDTTLATTEEAYPIDVEAHGLPSRLFPHVFERRTAASEPTTTKPDLGYRALTATTAETLVMASKDKVAWVRDEALASIVAVDFVDAPTRRVHHFFHLNDTAAKHHHHHHHISFTRRLELQLESVTDWFESILGAGAALADAAARKQRAKKANAERYGFDKLAVAGSKAGRVAAIASHTGDVLWTRIITGHEDDDDRVCSAKTTTTTTTPSPSSPPVTIRAVLTTRHAEVDVAPEVAVVSEIGGATRVTRLDGHTGAVVGPSTNLGPNVRALLRTGAYDDAGTEILLGAIVSEDLDVITLAVVPETTSAKSALSKRLRRGKPLFGNLRLDLKEEEEGSTTSVLRVFQVVEKDRASHAIVAQERGDVVLTRGPSEKVEAIAYGIPGEAASSKAHIMGDDALLLKYLNPHLAAVCTTSEGGDAAPLLDAKLRAVDASAASSGVVPSADNATAGSGSIEPSTLYVTLVDVVAARVVARTAHPNGAGPCRMSLSENWVVAAYWNSKAKRQELASLSLHEGMIDRYGLSPFKVPEQETTFAARAAPPPVALFRTFAVEKPVVDVQPTLTARGIASKQFLVAVPPGQIAALDRRALDPRRPTMDLDKNGRPTSAARKKFERELDEGLHPYTPFVLLKPRSIITHTRQLIGLTNLFVTPAKLESTTLVFAAGVDVYAARYTPSGAFDLLADDFNHALLLLLLLGLGTGALLLRAAAKRKSLNLLWA